VKAFQRDNDLVVDGVAGEKTWSKLVATAPGLFTKSHRCGFAGEPGRCADALQVERAAIKAVYDVEAGGGPDSSAAPEDPVRGSRVLAPAAG